MQSALVFKQEAAFFGVNGDRHNKHLVVCYCCGTRETLAGINAEGNCKHPPSPGDKKEKTEAAG
jgi:hypothetical protein